MAKTIHIINGPNLGLLGLREPEIYGYATLKDVEASCRKAAAAHGLDVLLLQSDAEHEVIGFLHKARTDAAGVIINPGAFSHYSYAIYDALKMCSCPIVEVHISNLHKREEFRHKSLMTAAATGAVIGLGVHGYELAVEAIARLVSK